MDNPCCRLCGAPLKEVFVDLGMSPLSNAYLTAPQTRQAERFYPLCAYACSACFLVQLPEFETPEAIFGDYAYFSSYSDSWLAHCCEYAQGAVERNGLGADSLVVELASNDGYLLQYFVERNVPVLGIEPARNVAEAAIKKGIPTRTVFFDVAAARDLVAEGKSADLVIGNNVLAHVPCLNDFVAGIAILLKRGGTLTMEFPHLKRLIERNQFDTIYHEHFSYFSFRTAREAFARHGIRLFAVDELPTHGGSLRIYGCHADDRRADEASVGQMLGAESAFGLDRMDIYRQFGEKARRTKRKLLEFLIEAKRRGKTIAGYGAPAKGNTLLNYCGVRTDFLDFTVDRSPAKQGKFLPGTHIPVYSPEAVFEHKPDYLLILPWNIAGEIADQMAGIRQWGGKFVSPIPEVKVF